MTRVLPTIPSFAPGPLSSASLNTLANAVAFSLNMPCFRMYQSVTQSVPNATWTQLILDVLDYDSDNGRSLVSPYTYTIPSNMAGRWTFSFAPAFGGNATGMRDGALYVNGAVVTGGQETTGAPASGNSADLPVRTITHACAAGDQIGLYAFQSSGGALNTDVASASAGASYLEGRLSSLGNP